MSEHTTSDKVASNVGSVLGVEIDNALAKLP
jgi:hypothetical protein